MEQSEQDYTTMSLKQERNPEDEPSNPNAITNKVYNDDESLDYDQYMVGNDNMYFEEGEQILTSSGSIDYDPSLLKKLKSEPTSNLSNGTGHVDKSKSQRKSNAELEDIADSGTKLQNWINNGSNWKYFEEVTEDTARCTFCHRFYKSSNGLERLKQHLVKRHPVPLMKIKSSRERKRKIIASNNRDTVWKYFKKKTAQKALCTYCDKVYKHSASITNLQRHLTKEHDIHFIKIRGENNDTIPETSDDSMNDSSVIKPMNMKLRSREILSTTDKVLERMNSVMEETSGEKITNSILYMLVVDKMPPSTVENKGFKNLIKTVAPLYTLPSTKTFEALLDERYKGLKNGSRVDVARVESYSLIFDNWTSRENDNKLNVFMRYVTKDLRIETITVRSLQLAENRTNEYLIDIINSIMRDSGLDRSKITAVINGGGSMMKRAIVESFGSEKYLDCFSYALSQILSNLLDSMPLLRSTIDKVKSIVTLTERSSVASDKLKQLQIRDGKTEETALKFIQENPRLWYTRLRMLERFLMLERYASTILSKYSKKSEALTKEGIEILRDSLSLMKHVESIVEKLSNDNFSTCSVIVPMINNLRNTIARYEPLTNYGFEFREKLVSMITAQFENIVTHEILALSTILDPRYKTSNFDNSLVAFSFGLSKIRDIIESKGSRKIVKIKTELTMTNEQSNENSIWKYHDELVAADALVNADNNQANFELTRYLNEPVLLHNEDPLEYWKTRKLDFPLLCEIAIKYFSIPGTSVPSARLFHRCDDA